MSDSKLKETGGLATNIGFAVLAQAISLVSSLLMSLAVPKILGIGDYAYWQLFILYSGYIGLFLLGVHDGIFLRLGGVRIENLDWPRIKSEFFVVLLAQIAVGAVAMIVCSLAWSGGERQVVIVFVVFYGLVVNPASFLFYVLRASNLPNIFSTATILSSSLFLIVLLVGIYLRPQSFTFYIVGYIACQLVSSVYCYIHLYAAFSCRCSSLSVALLNIREDCAIGLKVTIAYYAGALIVGSTRMLIDSAWGIEAFGKFSLSVSIVNFLLTFMAQVSMVIFPLVKRMSGESQIETYRLIRSSIASLLPIVYILYYPGCALLAWWLPQYAESLRYLAIMLPICVFDCKMQLLVNTYLKAYRKENMLLWINVASLAIAVAASIAAASITESLIITIAVMVGVIAARSVFSEVYLDKAIGAKGRSLNIADVVLAIWFVVTAYCFESLFLTMLGMVLYYIFNRRQFGRFFSFVYKRLQR